MKKKIIVILATLFLASSVELFAFGIGIQGGANLGADNNGTLAITFKTNNFPAVFAVDFGIYENWFGIGATADWWIQNPALAKPLYWYYGIGLAGSVGVGGTVNFSIGGRVLTGLNLRLINDFLELYLQIAWQPTITLLPSPVISTRDILLHFPIAAGIRFWF